VTSAGKNQDHRGQPQTNGHASTEASSSTPQSTGRRFFSDLNPEATFLSRATSSERNDRKSPSDDIGVWVDKREWEAFVQQKTFVPNHETREDQRPHPTSLAPLVDIYFAKIHPILPLMDETEFPKGHVGGIGFGPLTHALCLVAAKDPAAAPYLKLGHGSSTLQPREFCSRLHASVMGALKTPSQFDKVTLIRILALASLHNNEGMEGAEEASMCLSQAMHHAQTLGIHLGQHSSPEASHNASMKRLFWCLWALDRMNSAINGRPIMMSDIDIAIEPLVPGESGFPAFDAWLRVVDLLNKIIAFYRPNYPTEITGWQDSYPGLEEIFDECGAWGLPESMRATIHLFYLAVAVLSHRSRGVKQIPRGTHSSIRQRLCAIEIVRLLESDHSRELHQLSIIPYAASLALSVSYSHLRQSHLRHQQEDARKDFRSCCRILQSLRRTWSSADTMATLGRKVLEELDKAPSLASFRVPRNVEAAAGGEKDVPCMPTITGQRTGLEEAVREAESSRSTEDQPPPAVGVAPGEPAAAVVDGTMSIFDGMDDVFDTYLDPNYPVNLDDLSFVDDLQPFGWSENNVL